MVYCSLTDHLCGLTDAFCTGVLCFQDESLLVCMNIADKLTFVQYKHAILTEFQENNLSRFQILFDYCLYRQTKKSFRKKYIKINSFDTSNTENTTFGNSLERVFV